MGGSVQFFSPFSGLAELGRTTERTRRLLPEYTTGTRNGPSITVGASVPEARQFHRHDGRSGRRRPRPERFRGRYPAPQSVEPGVDMQVVRAVGFGVGCVVTLLSNSHWGD